MRIHMFRQINAKQPLSERFRNIRHNYKLMAESVAAGANSWADGDPYQIADWSSIHTPIEAAVWSDLRTMDVNMWPQFPIGKYFVDFACPIKRRAIECDGAAYHNPKKDALRDAKLLEMGWQTLRIPGYRCFDEDLFKEIRQFLGVQV